MTPERGVEKEESMSHPEGTTAIPTKILVPIDFSPSSHTALDTAVEFAKKFQAEVVMLHVIPLFPSATVPDSISEAAMIEQARGEAERKLGMSQGVLTQGGIAAKVLVEVGSNVAGTILDAVEREHADMVVISTHGLSGWFPLVFGSIAEKIVKLAHVPVMLLRSPKTESSEGELWESPAHGS